MDPLASDYSFQSPYAYAANNPISFIDFMGLGPIYGADGTLTGWEVEEGEGPTQIAQKLNDSYACELSCEVTFTDIVNDNSSAFKNVFDGDGAVNDEFNEDFKSGNIAPGDELIVSQGIDQTEKRIDKIDSTVDSLREENRKLDSKDSTMTRQNYRDMAGPQSWQEGGKGAAAGRGQLSVYTVGIPKGRNNNQIKELQKEKKNLNKN